MSDLGSRWQREQSLKREEATFDDPPPWWEEPCFRDPLDEWFTERIETPVELEERLRRLKEVA